MAKFYNTCEICKHFSRFDNWCRVHARKERREGRACAYWEPNKELLAKRQEQKRQKLLEDLKSGELEPTDMEKIGSILGGWAWLRFYDPVTHEYEIEITNMPWEKERKTIAVYKYRKEQQP